jgi:hypothetical protein
VEVTCLHVAVVVEGFGGVSEGERDARGTVTQIHVPLGVSG